jgi:hypothetical protein
MEFKYTDGIWFWNTIEEYTTLVLFDCLDKIHTYNEEMERILANGDNLPKNEVAILVVLCKSKDTIRIPLGVYNQGCKQKHWPEIICNESTKWYCVFNTPTYTLV